MSVTEILPAVERKWTADEMALIKNVIAPKCSDEEVRLMLYQAKTYKLDPLLKQIWAIKYQEGKPASIFAGRDGFLAIAHQSGQFDGMESGSVQNDKGELIGARATVWRKDMKHPFVVTVKLNEYARKYADTVPKEFRIWDIKPETMIIKVAESQALRRAFNISGIYSPEEMDLEKSPIKEVSPVINIDEAQHEGMVRIHDPIEGDVWIPDMRKDKKSKK